MVLRIEATDRGPCLDIGAQLAQVELATWG